MVISPYYKIKNTDPIFVGYTIQSDGLPIGADGNAKPDPNGCWFYDALEKEWINYKSAGHMCIRVTMSGDNMPQNDVKLVNLNSVSYITPNTDFSVAATVYNKANSEVNSFDIVPYVADEEQSRSRVELKAPIKRGEIANVIASGLKLAGSGLVDVKYVVENINGQFEDDNAKDNSLFAKTGVSSSVIDRMVLLENFTTAACINCPAGHKYIEDALKEIDGEDDFAWIAHHAGYGTDQFTIGENSDALFFFNPSGTFAPAMMLDRLNLAAFVAADEKAVTSPIIDVNGVGYSKVMSSMFNFARQDKSPISLDIQHTYDAAKRELVCNVSGSVLAELTSKNSVIGIALIEDGLTGMAQGPSGVFTFNNVTRDFLTSVFGDDVTISDKKFTHSASMTLPPKFEHPENMSVVVWVGEKPATKNRNGYNIYQTAKVKLVK